MAESSFFKINSQGTPLDQTETTLIKNRRKPIAISARAILRSGTGNKYWTSFKEDRQTKLEELARQFFELLFEPEAKQPVKTLDLPLGGTVSPVDALDVLIEFLTLSGSKEVSSPLSIDQYSDDQTGEETIAVLERALLVLNRITGNSPGSLGLHPVVYFYNERGKHNRYMFLGVVQLIAERLRNNDGGFFAKFTKVRKKVEDFLMENKSLLGQIFSNMSKKQRISHSHDLINILVSDFNAGSLVSPEKVLDRLGLKGRFLDIDGGYGTRSNKPSDDAKSVAFIEKATKSALHCPVCQAMLDPQKSVTYDHIVRVRDGGSSEPENLQLAHPYCNSAIKG